MWNHYVYTKEELMDSPSRKDGVDEPTETILRVYGCTLIQEAGILLKLPQSVTATGQILFHRFYCMQSFARFFVNSVAASCIWLASNFKENPRKARHVVIVFHRIDCRRKNLPIEFLDRCSEKYAKLKRILIKTERWVLKELGFICQVEYPYKLVVNYLSTLEAQQLIHEAWNIANDCLRTTLCVRFKAEVLACGVIYAAARRCQVNLPENPPWWEVFEVDKSEIDQFCRVMADLYSIPDVKHVPVYGDGDAFTVSESWDLPPHVGVKEDLLKANITRKTRESVATLESVGYKEVMIKPGTNFLKENSKIGEDYVIRSLDRNVRVHNVSGPSESCRFQHPFPTEGKETEPMKKGKIEETVSKSCSRHRIEDVRGSRNMIDDVRGERNKQRQCERKRERLRLRSRW